MGLKDHFNKIPLEDKKIVVSDIEFLLREYDRTERKRKELWNEQEVITSAINERILGLLIGDELISKIKDFKGKKVLISVSTDILEIINCTDVIFNKHDIRIKGEGVRYCGDEVHKSYGPTISLYEAKDVIEKFKVLDDGSDIINNFYRNIKERRQRALINISNKINNTYDNIEKEFTSYLSGREPEEFSKLVSVRCRDSLSEVADIRLGELKNLLLDIPDPDERYVELH